MRNNEISVDNNLFKKAYWTYWGWLAFSFLLTMVGSLVGSMVISERHVIWVGVLTVAIAVVFMLCRGKWKSNSYMLFCFAEGLLLSPVIVYYLDGEPLFLVGVLALLFMVVTVFMFIGYLCKGMWRFSGILFTLLLIDFAMCLFGMFYGQMLWPFFGVVLFSFYIAYHISCFRKELYECAGDMNKDMILDHVMNQYLSILNLFTHLIDMFLN